jgi:DNA-binding IclR family transcriptional regulator
VEQRGYCTASWQPEVVALATPLVVPDGPIYVLNVSVSTAATPRDAEAELSGALLDLSLKVAAALGAHPLPVVL